MYVVAGDSFALDPYVLHKAPKVCHGVLLSLYVQTRSILSIIEEFIFVHMALPFSFGRFLLSSLYSQPTPSTIYKSNCCLKESCRHEPHLPGIHFCFKGCHISLLSFLLTVDLRYSMLFRSGLHNEVSGNSSNSRGPAPCFYLSTSN